MAYRDFVHGSPDPGPGLLKTLLDRLCFFPLGQVVGSRPRPLEVRHTCTASSSPYPAPSSGARFWAGFPTVVARRALCSRPGTDHQHCAVRNSKGASDAVHTTKGSWKHPDNSSLEPFLNTVTFLLHSWLSRVFVVCLCVCCF